MKSGVEAALLDVTISAPIWAERLVTTPANGAVSRVKPCSAWSRFTLARLALASAFLACQVAILLVGFLLGDGVRA